MAEENRIRSFKNKGKDCEEMRRRRIGQTIELRKARKDDQLLKRRNISSVDEEPTSPQLENEATSPVHMKAEEIMYGMINPDESIQLQATLSCRKILSRERNPPIDQMIRLGVVPRCVDFLSKDHNPALQFEACWALTNIASGTSEQTAAVVHEGAIPKLQLLLKSPRIDVVEQAVWALGNIAGDGALTRDMVLASGVLPEILRLINADTSISLMRNAVWAVSNLCRNKNPAPDFERVRPILPTLALLLSYTDKDVLADSCWALSYLTDGSNERIEAVLEAGLISRLVQLLTSNESTVLTPALRAVGNIVTGNDAQTDVMGCIKPMCNLLNSKDYKIVSVVLNGLDNILSAAHKLGETDKVAILIEECGGLDLIEALQAHDNENIYDKALSIIENYFSE
ncbi:hypothetical protein YQE_01907, partial [Dendroctonus ponderosae]